MDKNYCKTLTENNTENNTTENENNDLKFFESSNKDENMLINKSPFNGIINLFADYINKQRLNQKIMDIFGGQNDDDKLTLNQDDENSINNYIIIGKKRLKECKKKYVTHNNDCFEKNGKNKVFKINKVIKINDKPIYRLDYYKKFFIKTFLNFLLNYGKKLISKCKFEEQPELHLHKPNYKLYAGNPKEKDNKEFLKKSIKKVFMDYDKNDEKGIGRQIENENIINDIYDIKDFPSSNEEKELNVFFNMTIEKGIELFYVSEEFQEIKNNEKIQYYDRMFYQEKKRNFSLLEKYGFIKLVNLPFYSHNPK